LDNNEEKERLANAVREDVNLYLSAAEQSEISQVEMLAWRSGYVAGYNRRKVQEEEV
jgi:hypothetical protein